MISLVNTSEEKTSLGNPKTRVRSEPDQILRLSAHSPGTLIPKAEDLYGAKLTMNGHNAYPFSDYYRDAVGRDGKLFIIPPFTRELKETSATLEEGILVSNRTREGIEFILNQIEQTPDSHQNQILKLRLLDLLDTFQRMLPRMQGGVHAIPQHVAHFASKDSQIAELLRNKVSDWSQSDSKFNHINVGIFGAAAFAEIYDKIELLRRMMGYHVKSPEALVMGRYFTPSVVDCRLVLEDEVARPHHRINEHSFFEVYQNFEFGIHPPYFIPYNFLDGIPGELMGVYKVGVIHLTPDFCEHPIQIFNNICDLMEPGGLLFVVTANEDVVREALKRGVFVQAHPPEQYTNPQNSVVCSAPDIFFGGRITHGFALHIPDDQIS